MNYAEQIQKLKKEKDVVILAHYYVEGAVQDIADFVGDSYALAKKAAEVEQKNILFCGVRFMGESAKLLNPQKKVYMPDDTADCPMAHMVTVPQVKKIKAENPDVAVVCYVNSTAEIKSVSDVCVTSSNAIRVVKKMKQNKIFFIPDNHLAHFVAESCPEKEFIFHDGFCPTHQLMTKEALLRAKEEHPNALVLAHPECSTEILDNSDYIGSTAEIINYAHDTDCEEFIIATAIGVFHKLQKDNPDKKFYPVMDMQICPNMAKVTIDKVVYALEHMEEIEDVVLEDEVMEFAKNPLEQMLELAK